VTAITVYSRPGCHLCDEMKATVARVVQAMPTSVDVHDIDISTDPELESRYGLEIPVLLVDGKKAAKFRVTEGELRRILDDKAGQAGGAGRAGE
jgi:thiol-disulfide isomerase/thioredoxin